VAEALEKSGNAVSTPQDDRTGSATSGHIRAAGLRGISRQPDLLSVCGQDVNRGMTKQPLTAPTSANQV